MFLPGVQFTGSLKVVLIESGTTLSIDPITKRGSYCRVDFDITVRMADPFGCSTDPPDVLFSVAFRRQLVRLRVFDSLP